MSRSTSTARSRTWLRVLALLLALWVPGAHVPAQPVPDLAVAAESDGHDILDTPLRPPARAVHRADAPERLAPLPGPAPARPAARPRPAAPRMPSTPPLLRTVVLRC
ncbi:hypothetical protein JK361_25035 [Streptomyces sp. 5-8]|uniref:Secreted protein n=1 Tax=Streptomyces musisoli TaxID=2802280 RepID=A0ABS1P7C2_9ACTN|nr:MULTISPECIES: hypothetical protein [Streptomyces]MBL1107816.1 hypothetical protein [Streptomyces musisoli]MBY8843077.1 hypothetical protein [Streptomyces sp. SP2-10]